MVCSKFKYRVHSCLLLHLQSVQCLADICVVGKELADRIICGGGWIWSCVYWYGENDPFVINMKKTYSIVRKPLYVILPGCVSPVLTFEGSNTT